MKRRLTILSVICTVLVLVSGVVTVGAETTEVNEWSVYVSEENEAGMPFFKASPTCTYTDKGLYVMPDETMAMYTVQSDRAYSLDEGFYLEFELEQISLENVLMVHIWDQSGVLVGNYNCGSGWCGMIAVDGAGNDYMMSLTMEAASGNSNGATDILGSMKVTGHPNGDGSGTYSVSVANGILRMNGAVVVGMDEAFSFLRDKRDDGCFYLGVTVLASTEGEELSPLTVTRFGKDETSATVPGTDGTLPETDESLPEMGGILPEPETEEPLESLPPVDESVSTPPITDTAPVSGESEIGSSEDTSAEPSTEQEGAASVDSAEGSEDTTADQSTLDKMKEVYDGIDVYGSCGATLGAGSGFMGLAMLLAAAFATRKRE